MLMGGSRSQRFEQASDPAIDKEYGLEPAYPYWVDYCDGAILHSRCLTPLGEDQVEFWQPMPWPSFDHYGKEKAIAKLDEARKKLFLHDVETLDMWLAGYSELEVARILGVAQPTVNYRRQTLVKRMKLAEGLPLWSPQEFHESVDWDALLPPGTGGKGRHAIPFMLYCYYLHPVQRGAGQLVGFTQGQVSHMLSDKVLKVLKSDHPLVQVHSSFPIHAAAEEMAGRKVGLVDCVRGGDLGVQMIKEASDFYGLPVMWHEWVSGPEWRSRASSLPYASGRKRK